MILVPLTFFMAGYISISNPGPWGADPLFFVILMGLLFPLFYGIYAILTGGVENRLLAWRLFFWFFIFSISFYLLMSPYWGLSSISKEIHFYIQPVFIGSFLMGSGTSELIYKWFFNKVFRPRMMEVGYKTKYRSTMAPAVIFLGILFGTGFIVSALAILGNLLVLECMALFVVLLIVFCVFYYFDHPPKFLQTLINKKRNRTKQ